ncbi:phosphatase PAP2 family protein [Spirilliplanes yamanashiensis]|uniref:Phosphatidic acid phosphatase n=1 Tax=Spirilliplanes yamanashiensis TaxID=42233 RepID=A0A8J3Y4X2_9ACTN|nr:membrane-associated phospholipid phosphatase [Spirilliplanes yamanashiensis]GIJ01549.1 phosphatidic acid phosphatase [Spirilliplanes yamanashiensis]
MTTALDPQPPAAPEPSATAPLRRRVIAMSIWAVLFAAGVWLIGLPTSDPVLPFLWLWLATIAWRSELPWRRHLAFLRDWAPVVVMLLIYNISRGVADGLSEPHVTELIEADEVLFGWFTGGVVPTAWLQEHLYQPGVVQWWEIVVSVVYFSHFLAVPAAAVVLWVRSRPQWARYMRRWMVLTLAGLITYFLYPAAPPWWARVEGYLAQPVERISTNGWDAIGLHSAGNTLNALQVSASNPVAAMPSLHTAYALLVIVFFLPAVRRRWWPLLLAYPLAMTFTLVYSGEHYIIDVLVGWAYVGAVFALVSAGERWWARRHPAPLERGALDAPAPGGDLPVTPDGGVAPPRG